MSTKEDAKRAVEAELHSQKLTKPMTLVEMTDFCQEMYKHLEVKSDSARLADIRKAVYELAPLGRLRTALLNQHQCEAHLGIAF